jgi:diaminopimelate dehydrogenase
MERARAGNGKDLTTRQKHIRDCYVVVEEGVDKELIRDTIINIPNYYAEYDTKVTFVSEEELLKNHSGMPHGGFVIRSGMTGMEGNQHLIEYSVKIDSNPEFTSSVLVCYARAAYRLSKKGRKGAKTALDIAPSLLSPKSQEELRRVLL